MNKFSALLIGATLVAGGSFAATAVPAQQGASPTSYNWLHPKLGMVKVDRATHAMLKSTRTASNYEEQRFQPAFVVAVNSGYVSERGEATYSGPQQRTTAQPMAQTNSRAMGASSGMALTRAQVLQELKDFRRNPVTSDGYQYVNGEIGYVYVGPRTSDN